MALDTSQFISFTDAGLSIANMTEIREALVTKYQSIYGSDIDLSTGSADGVFVNELALIINNIVQTCREAYSQLDVNYASDYYLDALCAQSNIFRRQATHSTASIVVTNIGGSSLTLDNPEFVDMSGEIWDYKGTLTLGTTSPSNSQSIVVICRNVGEIEAQPGWIYKTVDVQPLQITQANAAYVGRGVETDAELRARRAQSSGASGTTTIESMIGALLKIDGILDVKVFNNNTDTSEQVSGDNTYAEPHSVYIAIRKDPNLTIEDETIGSIIHQKLTPGVRTNLSTSASGTAKTWQFIDNVYGRQVVESEENIYWKECAGVAYSMTITIGTLFPGGNRFDTNTCNAIGANVISYLNALPIGTDIYNNDRTLNDIRSNAYAADPGYRGSPTFMISNLSVSSTLNPWAYYNYTTTTYVAIHEDNDPSKPIIGYTITIS